MLPALRFVFEIQQFGRPFVEDDLTCHDFASFAIRKLLSRISQVLHCLTHARANTDRANPVR